MSAKLDHYQASFERLQQRSEAGAWLNDLRQGAMTHFSGEGFPTTRHEEWKYTNVKPIADIRFGEAAADQSLEGLERHKYQGASSFVSVVNGVCAKVPLAKELPQGVVVCSLKQALKEHAALVEPFLGQVAKSADNTFLALNTAMISDGLFVYVPENTTLAVPIEAIFSSSANETPSVSYPRNLYVLGRGAKATVIETYLGDHDCRYLTNSASEIVLQANASMEHIKVGLEGPAAYHVATIEVQQARDSRFTSRSFSFGGKLVRNDINSSLHEEGAECDFQGLYLATGTQHVDHHTAIDHRVAHCKSSEVYKGVLSGQAEGVFNGKVYVRKDAQKTVADQSNKNLLLSPDATINTKPQLEIFADDVRCTHGATIGQLDSESVFYLRSRGLSDVQARAILVRAFAHEVIDNLENEELQKRLGELLESHLAAETRRETR